MLWWKPWSNLNFFFIAFTSNSLNNRYLIKNLTFSEAGSFKKAKSVCGQQETRQRERNPHVCPIDVPFTASRRSFSSAWAAAPGCRGAGPTEPSTSTARPQAEAVGSDLPASSGCNSLQQPAVCPTRYCEIPPLSFPLFSMSSGGNPHDWQNKPPKKGQI